MDAQEEYLGYKNRKLIILCTKELVEMQYLKPNWSEISKKGVHFLNLITRGNIYYDDSKVNLKDITQAFENTEHFFGRVFLKLDLNDDSGVKTLTDLKNKSKTLSAVG